MIFLRVSLFFLVLLLLPDWYIYSAYLKHRQSIRLKRLYWIPSIVLILALVPFFFLGKSMQGALGTYLIVALCIAVPKAVFCLFHLLLKSVGRLLRIRLFAGTTGCLMAAATFCYILFGAVKGKEYFQVKEVTFASAQLPEAFDGYRILQLSDLHIGSWKGNREAIGRAVDLCNAQHPDLIVFTGDLVNSLASEVVEFMPLLARLKAPDGVYSIMGNHDYATYARWDSEAHRLANIDTLIQRERAMGWDMLTNDHRILHRGSDSIALVGVENSGNPPFPDLADLPKALCGTDGLFKVLLSHDPTHWRRNVLPETDIHLMLSGHTHDMQVSLFGLSPSALIYPEHHGMYLERGRGLYVNVGLGYVLFPMRLGAWPEITVITLRKE